MLFVSPVSGPVRAGAQLGGTMPQYAALIYVEDLDRTENRQSEETKQYAEFGAENAAAIRGGAGL
jgi:hypothetical protein